jgi:hypothetical protein
MLKGVLLVFVPIGLACLDFAAGASAIYRGADLALPAIVLTVGGVLLVYAAIRAVGSGVFASFGKEAKEKDVPLNVEPSIQKGHAKAALIFLAAGVAVTALGLVLGGEPLLDIVASVLSA